MILEILISVIFTVDDDVVYDIVKKKIGDYEKEGKDWIIEGFPRNKN